jgi:uncharacterized protein
MVKDILRKIFGGFRQAADTPQAVAADSDLPPGPARFVDYVVKSLVDTPSEVKVVSEDDDRGTVIRIRCKKEEIGRIIGKNGKTITAIRSLVVVCGSRDGNRRTSVMIKED